MSLGWQRPFGTTGLLVSAVGFGAGHIGEAALGEADAGRLLNRALDLGITLFDTARGYGLSEERIGRHLAHRRGEYVLSTKVGYGIPGHADWTPGIIGAGVTEALRRLRTDYIDIVHLHSCPRDTLERSGVVEALAREVQAGRVRVAAYSGDNDALAAAVAGGAFQSVQCSVNIVDQWALRNVLPEAARRGLGVIAKRPMANAPWRFTDRPLGHYAETYWTRWKTLGLDPRGLAWGEIALRFLVHHPAVSASIVGTRDERHLAANLDEARRGPLPADWLAGLAAAYERDGGSWPGEV